MSTRSWIIALWLIAPLLVGGKALTTEMAQELKVVELKEHPELEIPPAFGIGVESGGAGSALRGFGPESQHVAVQPPPPSLDMLPSIKDATCASVDGICACVASAGNYCNANPCEVLCLKTP